MTIQDRLSIMLGISPDSRVQALADLYQATERHPLAYWLQLTIATGIAYLGLVLNSSGVVIGAMLVSPLMTPIVQVGVSFSIGHSYLAARASLRILKSVGLVMGVAAMMTLLLPFHEVTAEILARTQPTALDLAVALFCGLAAAFTTARTAHDVFSTASGTAIAIALVPPLCVAGFGIGIANPTITTGSLLLFTANISAIILVTDLFFLVLGFSKAAFGQAESRAINEEDRQSPLYRFIGTSRIAKILLRWRRLRLILPLLFVVSVAFPLGLALIQVSWEINTKKRVGAIMDDFEKKYRVLNRQITVSHGAVTVRLTVVDSPGRSMSIRNELLPRLAAAAGQTPSLALDVLPSSEFMSLSLQQSREQLNRQLAEFRLSASGSVKSQGSADPSSILSTELESALRQRCRSFFSWLREKDPASDWIGWELGIGDGVSTLTLRRLAGETSPAADTALLAAVCEKDQGLQVTVREEQIPAEIFTSDKPVTASTELDRIAQMIERALALGTFHVRLELRDPGKAHGKADRQAWEKTNTELARLIKDRLPAEHLEIIPGRPRWSVVRYVIEADGKASAKEGETR